MSKLIFLMGCGVFAACACMPELVAVKGGKVHTLDTKNYKTTVSGGNGKYRAEGLMFHMPGRWEYIFEVRAGGVTGRLTTSVVLQ